MVGNCLLENGGALLLSREANPRIEVIPAWFFLFFLYPVCSRVQGFTHMQSICVCAWLLSRVWLFATPMDYSPPGSSVHGILYTRILEWTAMPSSRGSSPPSDQTLISSVSCIAGRFFTGWAIREAHTEKVDGNNYRHVNSIRGDGRFPFLLFPKYFFPFRFIEIKLTNKIVHI